jgi:HK97 family phage portal protein
MGILSKRLKTRTSLEQPDSWLIKWFGGGKTASGATVNNYTALNYSAFWSCIRVISKPVATMPIHVYEKLAGGGKQRAIKHPAYKIVHDRPNSEMVPLVFKDTLTAHLLTWGNAYAEIEVNNDGFPIALWPLTPNRVTPQRNINGEIQYEVVLPTISINQLTSYGGNYPPGTTVKIPKDRMFHIPGPGFDGLKGYSVLTMFRESIGLGMSLQEYAARFFGNGAMPGGVLEHPTQLSDPGKNYLRESWNEMHQGLDKSHRIAILEEGMKYKQIGISPEDAQMLESRKFSQVEMASIFQIPPHKIGNLEKSSFNNIEHQSQEFYTDTLLYWLTLWEETINWKLMNSSDNEKYFAEFLAANLLKADTPSRYSAYAVARQWGWMCADDIRELENQNPLPDGQGKIYLIPMNMMPASMTGHDTTKVFKKILEVMKNET